VCHDDSKYWKDDLLDIIILGLPVFIIIFLIWRWRRGRVQIAIPLHWGTFLHKHVRFYRCLDEAGQTKFLRDVADVMRTTCFEGIKGYEPSEEIKLMVAVGFATFFHGLCDRIPQFRQSIILYPGDSFSDEYEPETGDIAGMATLDGPMLLAAESVREGFEMPNDGFNPVIHELAHYLDIDMQAGQHSLYGQWESDNDHVIDDLPAGLDPETMEKWRRVRDLELEKVRRGTSPLRDYSLSDEGELFATAVEVFFENPQDIRRQSPEFYLLLCDYFHLDPASIYSRDGKHSNGFKGKLSFRD